MDDGMDYDVQTTVHFRLDFDGSGEFNMLLLPDVQKQFVQHVKEVYEQDNTLGSIRPKFIYRCLDDDIGNAVHGGFKAAGKSNAKFRSKHGRRDADSCKGKLQRVIAGH